MNPQAKSVMPLKLLEGMSCQPHLLSRLDLFHRGNSSISVFQLIPHCFGDSYYYLVWSYHVNQLVELCKLAKFTMLFCAVECAIWP